MHSCKRLVTAHIRCHNLEDHSQRTYVWPVVLFDEETGAVKVGVALHITDTHQSSPKYETIWAGGILVSLSFNTG
jgi:hypothetical protein